MIFPFLAILIFTLQLLPSQAAIKNKIRSTTTPGTFFAVFDQSTSFSSSDVTLSVEPSQTLSTPSITSIDDTTYLISGIFSADIEVSTVLTFEFSSSTFETSSISVDVQPTGTVESGLESSLKGASDADLYLDAAFGLFNLANVVINPFSVVLLHGTWLRETFDMLKMSDVSHQPFGYYFLKRSEGSKSGIRIPNFFGMLVNGNDFTSSYVREEEPYPSDRFSELAGQSSSNRYYAFYESSNYWDQFGQNMESIGFVLGLVITIELILICAKPKPKSFIFRLRVAYRWNLFTQVVFGAFQSAIFYFILNIISFIQDYNTTNGDVFGLVAGVFFFIVMIFWPIWTFIKVRAAGRLKKLTKKAYWAYRYINMFGPIKSDKIKVWPIIFFGLMLRSLIFAIMIAVEAIPGVVQAPLVLAASIGTLVFICLKKFCQQKYMFVFYIMWESLLILYSGGLFMLSLADLLDMGDGMIRDLGSYLLVAAWILLAVLNLVFTLYEMIVLPILRKKQQQQVKDVQKTTEYDENGNEVNVIVVTNYIVEEDEPKKKKKKKRKNKKKAAAGGAFAQEAEDAQNEEEEGSDGEEDDDDDDDGTNSDTDSRRGSDAGSSSTTNTEEKKKKKSSSGGGCFCCRRKRDKVAPANNDTENVENIQEERVQTEGNAEQTKRTDDEQPLKSQESQVPAGIVNLRYKKEITKKPTESNIPSQKETSAATSTRTKITTIHKQVVTTTQQNSEGRIGSQPSNVDLEEKVPLELGKGISKYVDKNVMDQFIENLY